MTGFQIVSVLFALSMLYIVNIQSRKSKLAPLEVSFWYTIWIFFICIALFPNLLLGIANLFHFARTFDMLVVIAFMVLSTLVVTSYFREKENSVRVEEMIRKQALMDLDFPKKKSRKSK
jgi:hypothetical protein